MPLDTYQSILSASIGAFIAVAFLLMFGGRFSVRKRWLIVGVAVLGAIAIEQTIWPMKDAFDPRRLLAASLGGAIGGIVGGGIGALFGQLREGKKMSLVLPLAVVGFLVTELADFGGTRVGKGFLNALLPPVQRPGAGDMTFGEFRTKLIENLDDRNSGMTKAIQENPEVMDTYFRWLQEYIADGEARGLTQSEIKGRIFSDAGLMTDDLLLRANEAAVAVVLALRLDMVKALIDIDPSYCLGSFNDVARIDPKINELIAPFIPAVLGRLLPFEGHPKKPQLPQTEFVQISETLISEVFADVGDAVFVFIGEVPVTANNRADYCAAEAAFMTKLNSLPSGAIGPREEYYQTLIAMVSAIQ